ncbi:hypothetical protein LIER_10711 [Lithospermum erythrorhizon]|uniref:RNase H type-1 domain-containing protein n=1 Tax=Lithospermum erythrorhizon TaxID=34254 RepID=A0AAV3PLT1_LITER
MLQNIRLHKWPYAIRNTPCSRHSDPTPITIFLRLHNSDYKDSVSWTINIRGFLHSPNIIGTQHVDLTHADDTKALAKIMMEAAITGLLLAARENLYEVFILSDNFFSEIWSKHMDQLKKWKIGKTF